MADASKTLGINFDRYTGGDKAAKSRLINRMIEDIKTLQKSLSESLISNQVLSFRIDIANVSQTISILDHARFARVLEFLKFMPNSAERDIVVESFCELSEDILNSLHLELK